MYYISFAHLCIHIYVWYVFGVVFATIVSSNLQRLNPQQKGCLFHQLLIKVQTLISVSINHPQRKKKQWQTMNCDLTKKAILHDMTHTHTLRQDVLDTWSFQFSDGTRILVGAQLPKTQILSAREEISPLQWPKKVTWAYFCWSSDRAGG